ncbi:MAG TPA: LemA family protein [bacterium]|nr:LemA family protein [bacterium]HPS29556.1 LemA family protein [bacterium]
MMNKINLLVAIVAAFLLSSCGYNAMQAQEEEVFKAWGDLESSMQRRADLIPNLVSTVKGYAKHESETLEKIVEMRASVGSVKIDAKDLGNAEAMAKFQRSQGEISSGLSKLLVVAEQYPDLKANENFRDLQSQLEGTENRINVARQRYNDAVSTFNASIRSFPNSMINGWFLHLERKEYFKAEEKAKEVPKVEF